MPVQRFAPMTKDFPTFDCDAHVAEPSATPDGQAELRFSVSGSECPRFSYDYWLIDDPRLVAKGLVPRIDHGPVVGSLFRHIGLDEIQLQ